MTKFLVTRDFEIEDEEVFLAGTVIKVKSVDNIQKVWWGLSVETTDYNGETLILAIDKDFPNVQVIETDEEIVKAFM